MRALDQADDWPAANTAIAVVTADDGLIATKGDSTRPYPWASVTKLVTALAVLVAVEDGSVPLDTAVDPADAGGQQGVTVEHLLAHASGLAPDERRPLAPAGTRRIYSNAGFELLADVVAARTGIAFPDYVHEAVLESLGMTGARLDPDASPAAGLVGTLDDLARLAAELLRPTPTVLAPETRARATATAFPGLNGVLPGFGRQSPCDWGLGFEVRDHKSPHWTGSGNSPETFGHFGRSGTFLWVDPAADGTGAALAVLTDEPFGAWAAAAWPALSDAVLSEQER